MAVMRDRTGVPNRHEVIQWMRRECAECGTPFELPFRAIHRTDPSLHVGRSTSRSTNGSRAHGRRARGSGGKHGGNGRRPRVLRYDIHARRCWYCRRPYEEPGATPHLRDAQRSAVYRWEYGLRHDWSGDGVARALRERLSEDLCAAFTHEVWAFLYPRDRYGPPEVAVSPRRRVESGADAEEIHLAPRMANRLILLHEIGHSYLSRVLPNGSHVAHGPEFTAVYLHLLGEFLGVDDESARERGARQRPGVRFADERTLARIVAVGQRRDGQRPRRRMRFRQLELALTG